MTEATDNSSLPLLLSITGAVLAVAAGGWFFLNQQTPAPDTGPDAPDAPLASIEDASPADANPVASTALEADVAVTPEERASINVDAELRKARLAAGADILVLPVSQSALYYYGRVLTADPEHAIAAAELDSMLAQVSRTVTRHLNRQEYADAYEIAVLVAKQAPEHELVTKTQRTLDQYTERLVEQAIQLAQDGDDEQATEILAVVEELPGRSPAYLAAVNDSIDEIRLVRVAAEQDREQRAQLADDEAKAAWVALIRAAIEEGNLITPVGASARDLLAESNTWTTESDQLNSEFLAGLLAAAESSIGAQQLEHAETLLVAVDELDSQATGVAELRSSLESAFIEARSNRILSTRDLTFVKSVAPQYPSRASTRGVSGWATVQFVVTHDGTTENVEVSESEPEELFNRAAIKAVEQWVFEPVEYRGQIISQRAATRIVFKSE